MRTALAGAASGALAVLGLLGGPAAHAASGPGGPSVYYVGDDGGLWSYGQQADGSWTTAAAQGPAGVAPPGAPVAATRLPGGPPTAYLVGSDGSLLEDCPATGGPVALTKPGFTAPGTHLTATVKAGHALVTVPLAALAGQVLEIPHPCGPPTALLAGTPLDDYKGGAHASTGLSDGGDALFWVDAGGAVRVQWRAAQTGAVSEKQLTAPGTAKPGGGVAVADTEAAGTSTGVVTLLFTGHDGRVYVAHPVEGGALADVPLPDTTAPVKVPDGAELALPVGKSALRAAWAAGDGTVTVATLSPAGQWQHTDALSGPGFTAPGSSVATAPPADGGDGGDGEFCGTYPHRPVRRTGPLPDPPQWGWQAAGPDNVTPGAVFAWA
ncbi:hypothetical protein [Streptomyces sp. HPF1205]|uniref:hypothetical protein n=1 Tax=Streptomyces sp. HPF1205 TaxID=2873262 RepID=UPI001CEC7195|nr:hypothetical protein [Streptomyces sp. HPF1205]